MITLFLSPVKLKEQYVLDANIDDKIINASINNAQGYYIRRVLGTKLYERCVNEINNTLSMDIKVLLDEYIQPALIHYSMSEIYNYLLYRATARGIVVKDNDGSVTVNSDVIEKLRREEISKGNYYADLLTRYIIDNQSKYPEYNQSNGVSDVPPQNNFRRLFYGYDYNNDSDIGYYYCN